MINISGIEFNDDTVRTLESVGLTAAAVSRDTLALYDGRETPAELLVHCLSGADDVHAAAWRDYVDTIVAHVGVPALTQNAEIMRQLRQAALQLVLGFERAMILNPEEQIATMREASSALEEMRGAVGWIVSQHSNAKAPGSTSESPTGHTCGTY